MADARTVERLLYAWQRASSLCVHAGKTPEGPWSLRVLGTCSATGRVALAVISEAESFDSALLALADEAQFKEAITKLRLA